MENIPVVKSVFIIDDIVLITIMLIMMIIASVLSMVLTPVPPPPRAASISDFKVPTAEAGRPVPVIFGTVMLKGPNVVWYGNLFTDPIPYSGGGSS
jgi:hypothetical protein